MGKKAKRRRSSIAKGKKWPLNAFTLLSVIFVLISIVVIVALNISYFFIKKTKPISDITNETLKTKDATDTNSNYDTKEKLKKLQIELSQYQANSTNISDKKDEYKEHIKASITNRTERYQSNGLLAIIIDDIGNNINVDKELITLSYPITLSILPHLVHTKDSMFLAKKHGKEVMLHQPMEPVDRNVNSGIGSLFVNMTKEEIHYVFLNNLKDVELAVGVNNHMGSRFTQDRLLMDYFLEIVRDKGLIFVDSITHPNSVGYEVAVKMGIKALKRDVFLDSTPDKSEIRKSLYYAVKIAQRNGKAIAIGHPYPETIEVLKEELEKVNKMVTLVYVSQLFD